MMSGQENEEEHISTKHILFTVSGAFSGLEDIIEKREKGSKFGFDRQYEQNSTKKINLENVQTTDLVNYGFETEFIGRLPVKVACQPLTQSDLKNILTDSKASHIKQCVEAFKGYDISTIVTDCAYDEIAKKAIESHTLEFLRKNKSSFARIFIPPHGGTKVVVAANEAAAKRQAALDAQLEASTNAANELNSKK